MATLLNIKDYVADLIGTGDGSTVVPKRDRIINAARRQFYSERRWSFLLKNSTLTFSSKLASLPTDYNKKFDPINIYSYSGNSKYYYEKVPYDELDSYGESYVYSIDKNLGKIKISRSDSTATIEYTYLPTDAPIDATQNSTDEPTNDITPIGLLALGMWYLGSRQSGGKYQLFKDEYKSELQKAIQSDPSPIRKLNPRTYLPKFGYRGRG